MRGAVLLVATAVWGVGTTSGVARKRPPPVEDDAPAALALLRAGLRGEAFDHLTTGPEPSLLFYRDRYRYVAGRLAIESGDAAGTQRLREIFPPMLAPRRTQAPGADDRRLAWLIRGELLAGNLDPAVAALQELQSSHPDAPDREELTITVAEALVEAGRFEDAGATLEGARPSGGHGALEARILRLQADLVRTAKPDEAREIEIRLLVRHPDHEAARRPGLSIGVDDLSLGHRWRRALKLMDAWEYTEARAELEHLRKSFYNAKKARWLLADIALDKLRDDRPGARKLVARYLEDESSPKREEAMFLTIRAFVKEDRYEDATKLLKTYQETFPAGEFAEPAAYYRAWLPYDQRRCRRALPHMRRYIKRFSKRREAMRSFRAWCRIRLEQWETAVRSFQPLLRAKRSLERARALYWQAFALEKLGQGDEARANLARLDAKHPLTWYAFLGKRLLALWDGHDPRASALSWPQGGGDAARRHAISDWRGWNGPRLTGGLRSTWTRIRQMAELGEWDLARRAFAGKRYSRKKARKVARQIAKSVPADKRWPFVAWMGWQVRDYQLGWHWMTIGSVLPRDARPDVADPRWILAYPLAYQPLVERLGEKHRVEPHFVYSLMRAESGYQPSAISHADAVGALQMIYPTARKVAAELGVEFDPRTFARPEVGFEYSFHYLAKHLALWRGQLVPTAASYNAGPEPVARWMADNAGSPIEFLVEEFVYGEARNYVRKVADHVLRYLYLYEPSRERRGPILDALFPLVVDYRFPDDVGY